MNVNVKQTV